MSIRRVRHAPTWSTWLNRGSRRERIGGWLLVVGIGTALVGALTALAAALGGNLAAVAWSMLAVAGGLAVDWWGARIERRRWS